MKQKTKRTILIVFFIPILMFFIGCGGSSSDDVSNDNPDDTQGEETVNVNAAPEADAGGPYNGMMSAAVSLSGAASTDSDGTITAYAWDLDNDGQYDDGNGVTAVFSSNSAGMFTVGLRVTDDDGATDTASATVTVTVTEEPNVTPNAAPTADAGGPYNGTVGAAISLSGAASTDQDGAIIAYAWDLDNDGQYDDGIGLTVVFSSNSAGTFTIVLRVTDDDGATDTAPATVTVTEEPNIVPVADAGGPYNGTVGVAISLSGAASTDPDGTITAYAWDLDNDGSYDDTTGMTVDFNADTEGTFTIGLRVTDNDGGMDTDTTTVTIAEDKPVSTITYPIVDTGQTTFYNNSQSISKPAKGKAFYGQDAHYNGNQPDYTVSVDGLTVLDNVTGLTWTQEADWDGDGVVNVNDKFTYDEAPDYVETLNAQNYGGFNDWRVPTIKELYSLIDYNGTDPIPTASSTSGLVPFIDDDIFEFAYGDTASGDRIIDSQWVTTTLYVGKVMNNNTAMFGVNFADGRIKGYPAKGDKTFYARFCRGNTDYGINNFNDNGDGSITDLATGLMWSQADSREAMNWEDALAWTQEKNDQGYLGYSDWRLPNAKELQSLVDYTRSPGTTGSAAIDPLFNATQITDEAGESNYPFYWSSTTFLRFNGGSENAVYVAFGEGLGSMDGRTVIDVHGAGCQRSDPKDGDSDDYPSWGFGPQGDVQRVFNFVRLVRDADNK